MKRRKKIQKTWYFRQAVQPLYIGKGISRKHFEFHKFKKNEKISWKILDKKSQTHVYVNGNVVPKDEFLPLNDRDVISVGGNYNSIEASGDKRIFFSLV